MDIEMVKKWRETLDNFLTSKPAIPAIDWLISEVETLTEKGEKLCCELGNAYMRVHELEAVPGACKWTPWNEDIYGIGTHDTGCGNAHALTEGNIEENHYRFCPFCGKKIESC